MYSAPALMASSVCGTSPAVGAVTSCRNTVARYMHLCTACKATVCTLLAQMPTCGVGTWHCRFLSGHRHHHHPPNIQCGGRRNLHVQIASGQQSTLLSKTLAFALHGSNRCSFDRMCYPSTVFCGGSQQSPVCFQSNSVPTLLCVIAKLVRLNFERMVQ